MIGNFEFGEALALSHNLESERLAHDIEMIGKKHDRMRRDSELSNARTRFGKWIIIRRYRRHANIG